MTFPGSFSTAVIRVELAQLSPWGSVLTERFKTKPVRLCGARFHTEALASMLDHGRGETEMSFLSM